MKLPSFLQMTYDGIVTNYDPTSPFRWKIHNTNHEYTHLFEMEHLKADSSFEYNKRKQN